VDIDRLAEIGIGVHIVLALRRGGEAELHGWSEVIEDASPVALVIRAAAMAFVNDDEIEEVGRVFTEIWGGVTIPRWPAHERLEDREKEAAVRWHAPSPAYGLRFDAYQRVLGEGGKRVVRLIGEDVAVCKE